ncbi:MAG: CoA transferase, partial [Flammeovirgaceae bacterium]
IFKTREGELVTFAVGSDEHFRRLCTFLGCPELTTNKNFVSNPMRIINRAALFDLLQQKVSCLNTDLILREMLNQKVPVGKIRSLDEVFSDPKAQNLIRQEMIGETDTK